MNVIKNSKGLTIIELLAVIVILGIIASFAIPGIQGVINNQRDKAIMSDIVQLVATAKIQMSDNECINKVCTYSPTLNDISFTSTKFDAGTVDFTDGNYPEQIKVTINDDTIEFKGRKKDTYRALISESRIFTERQLLDVLK